MYKSNYELRKLLPYSFKITHIFSSPKVTDQITKGVTSAEYGISPREIPSMSEALA